MEIFTPKTVRSAAVFLDRNLPGWEHYIDEASLSMGSCENCILGQLCQRHPLLAGREFDLPYEPYWKAVKVLGLGGLPSAFGELDQGGKDTHGKWLKEIAVRLAQPPVRGLGSAGA